MKLLSDANTDADITSVLLKLRNDLRNNYPSLDIILYGSVARGQSELDSDVDVLVLTEQEIDRSEKDRIHGQIYEASLENDIVISSIITSKKNWNRDVNKYLPFYENVQRDGILVA